MGSAAAVAEGGWRRWRARRSRRHGGRLPAEERPVEAGVENVDGAGVGLRGRRDTDAPSPAVGRRAATSPRPALGHRTSHADQCSGGGEEGGGGAGYPGGT